MTKSVLIFLALAALVCSACHHIKEEEKKLAGHYTYRSKGADKRFIDPDDPLGRNIIYADVVDYTGNDSFILARQQPSSKYLRFHLEFYLYYRYLAYAGYLRDTNIVNTEDGRFMKGFIETDSQNYKLFKTRNATENSTAADKNIGLTIADSLINNDPRYKKIALGEDNYWIIHLSKDSLLGPFSKAVYLRQRDLLRIPATLKLHDE